MSEIEEGEIVQDKDEFEKEKKNKVFLFIKHFQFKYLDRNNEKRKKSFKR